MSHYKLLEVKQARKSTSPPRAHLLRDTRVQGAVSLQLAVDGAQCRAPHVVHLE